ncbi:hypothetical protein [Pseudomonas sp. GCEP-101]|uniref:hypothetical protein n=1 Tax=Pseudomonas sp. GCEP-101 TaxID=2974552 RepID=UPI00223B91DC|nr:hypothetical protein [Pseudomonas sp. GCEP-101]
MEFDPAIDDAERLIRSTFSPEHYDGKEFAVTAISLTDLDSSGVSVDRERFTLLTAVNNRLEEQAARNPDKRQAAVYSALIAGEVRSVKGNDGSAAFLVKSDPIDGNEGHALILSATKLGKGGLRELRGKLLELMQRGICAQEHLDFK